MRTHMNTIRLSILAVFASAVSLFGCAAGALTEGGRGDEGSLMFRAGSLADRADGQGDVVWTGASPSEGVFRFSADGASDAPEFTLTANDDGGFALALTSGSGTLRVRGDGVVEREGDTTALEAVLSQFSNDYAETLPADLVETLIAPSGAGERNDGNASACQAVERRRSWLRAGCISGTLGVAALAVVAVAVSVASGGLAIGLLAGALASGGGFVAADATNRSVCRSIDSAAKLSQATGLSVSTVEECLRAADPGGV